MRSFIAVSLFAFSIAPVLAQSSLFLPDAMVQQYCSASQVTSGADFDKVTAIALRLAATNPDIHIAVANSSLINAWEVDISSETSLICIPVALVHFMEGEEGELAFILAHEVGHAIDDRCRTLKGRSRVAEHSGMGYVLAILFGHSAGDEAGDQRACEARADELGFNLMTRAGYDPNDAAAAFQRFSDRSALPATAPLFFARLAALGKDHPITPDRIYHVHKLIAHLASRPR
jgi:Zn-dependent protease with chaperone function